MHGYRCCERGVKSVVFPPLGTGLNNTPISLSWKIFKQTIKQFFKENRKDISLKNVTIASDDYDIYFEFIETWDSVPDIEKEEEDKDDQQRKFIFVYF